MLSVSPYCKGYIAFLSAAPHALLCTVSGRWVQHENKTVPPPHLHTSTDALAPGRGTHTHAQCRRLPIVSFSH